MNSAQLCSIDTRHLTQNAPLPSIHSAQSITERQTVGKIRNLAGAPSENNSPGARRRVKSAPPLRGRRNSLGRYRGRKSRAIKPPEPGPRSSRASDSPLGARGRSVPRGCCARPRVRAREKCDRRARGLASGRLTGDDPSENAPRHRFRRRHDRGSSAAAARRSPDRRHRA